MGVFKAILEDGNITLAVNGEDNWKRLDKFTEKYKPKTMDEWNEMLKKMREEKLEKECVHGDTRS